MAYVRIVLAALIIVSVIVLPVSGTVAVSTKPVDMAMTDHSEMPCCPCCDAHDNSKGSISCTVKCISVFGAVMPATAIAQAHLVGEALPSFVDGDLQGHERSPPTHPPPV